MQGSAPPCARNNLAFNYNPGPQPLHFSGRWPGPSTAVQSFALCNMSPPLPCAHKIKKVGCIFPFQLVNTAGSQKSG